MLVGVRTHDVQFMMTKMQKLNSQCALLGRRNGPRNGVLGQKRGGGGGKYFGPEDSNHAQLMPS